jgi:hypothetical protein
MATRTRTSKKAPADDAPKTHGEAIEAKAGADITGASTKDETARRNKAHADAGDTVDTKRRGFPVKKGAFVFKGEDGREWQPAFCHGHDTVGFQPDCADCQIQLDNTVAHARANGSV